MVVSLCQSQTWKKEEGHTNRYRQRTYHWQPPHYIRYDAKLRTLRIVQNYYTPPFTKISVLLYATADDRYIYVGICFQICSVSISMSIIFHSFIHCRHLYSASSSGATQKRSQPQRGRLFRSESCDKNSLHVWRSFYKSPFISISTKFI